MFFYLAQATQPQGEVTEFAQKLILTIVDKGFLALVVVFAGFGLNRFLEKLKGEQATLLEKMRGQQAQVLETFRSRRSLENELAKLREGKQLEFREKQLSQFYWPIYMRLRLVQTTRQRLSGEKGERPELREPVVREIEKSLVLPNLEAVVRLLEENIHLMENDGKLLKAMFEYIRYVEVLRALRAGGHHDVDPKDLGEPWPEDFPNMISRWAYKLQAQYEGLATGSAIALTGASEVLEPGSNAAG